MNYGITLDWVSNLQEIDILALNINDSSWFEDLYFSLYARAINIVAADGAANLLREVLIRRNSMDAPTLITGDMDSITEETKAYFQDVASVTDLDQDSTDFQKSLSNLKDERPIVVLGELGGRFDHSLHALSVLFEPQNLTKQIFIYNGKNLAFAINEGITTINLINRQVWKYIGIIPLAGPTIITTHGLKWNFESTLSEFGGVVSTCNEALEDDIVIMTDKPVLFTCSKL